jgi:hypothetical protein
MTDTSAVAEDVASAVIDLMTSANLTEVARQAAVRVLGRAGSEAGEATSILLRETQQAINQAGPGNRGAAVASAYKRWIRHVGQLLGTGTLSPEQAVELADTLRRIGKGTSGLAGRGLHGASLSGTHGSSIAGVDEDDEDGDPAS